MTIRHATGRSPQDGRTGGSPARPGPPVLLLIAHGSRDPRHAATVEALVGLVRELRPGTPAATAYLDHCAPRIPQVVQRLAAAGTPAVAVPLLLGRAYHAKTDIPGALRGSGLPVADVLGPSPLLLAALDRRLAEAGLNTVSPAGRARTGVVLAAAGSSDPAANAGLRAVAAEWRRTRGWASVEVAHASAVPPHVPQAVASLRAAGAERIAVAPYLVAPGLLPDRIAAAAAEAGADLVAPVLGAAPELARLLLHRYDTAASAARALSA
ncbi:sirohydrochlorin chelatase [Streptacidiphilus sp. ASG 303]|uniref:sirohydrochlorin chelatase n=1 Tax=Streptacidiphilus sp. ASG 303 TaxID=2896847 RepID=UPI001E4C01DA|nr:sirohydrochlorin chelatase [Streptacidiphilus sp. ASG 303]MCD0481524.1 sirohydrochlorin chelatase [Streptacidiphilus sp. ASG 303]